MVYIFGFFGFVMGFAVGLGLINVMLRHHSNKELKEMSGGHALLIGLSQTLALIPGVSRSGITMTSARFLGFSRTEAARFSLLLSIIAISGAGTLSGYQMIETENFSLTNDVLIAVGLSAISGWIAIALMMKWLSFATFKPFAIYRILLGIILLFLFYSTEAGSGIIPVNLLIGN